MENATVQWAFAVMLVVVIGSVAGPLAAGQEPGTDMEPPGVPNETLEYPGALLDNHTSLLIEDGFSAKGTGNVTIIRQNVLVDVEQTANRSVTANGTEYRESQRSVAEATVASVTRGEDFWGNDSVEAVRQMEGGETTLNVTEPRPDNRLSEAATIWPYLSSANYSVTDTVNVAGNSSGPGTQPAAIGGDQRFTLTATAIENEIRIEERLPEGATDPRNFSATVVVDEDGRIHAFEATVEYTIQGGDRTHTIGFSLQELGVTTVSQPPWVGDALASTANETGA